MKFSTLTLALLAVGLSSAHASQPASAPRSSTLLLTSPSASSYLDALSINDNGEVAGYTVFPGLGQHGYLYSGGVVNDLGTLGGSTSSATSVNNSGKVVGQSVRADGYTHGFVYSNGVMTDIGTLGGQSSFARGINSSGQITGYAYIAGSSANLHAFTYSNGVMKDLGTLGGTESYGFAINNSGMVTGSSYSATGGLHGFVWSNGTMTDLGTLGGTNSVGRAINNNGFVVGDATLATSYSHAFLYRYGTMTDLGTLGGVYSSALGINDSGQIVGTASTGAGTQHATLWNNGVAYDLNTLAPSGTTFYSAASINRHGQIVGFTTGSSPSSGFILTLHPDWQGGDGYWDDTQQWNFAGFGAFGISPGAPHDVVIAPGGSATVRGGANATVRSLSISGNTGELVTLDLNGGSTTTTNGTTLGANAVLAGNGRLGGALTVQSGAVVSVGPGQAMQLTGGPVSHAGVIRAFGTGAAPASLSVGGRLTSSAGSKINAQNANLDFAGGLTLGGQLNASLGNTNVSGNVTTTAGGQVIVSGNSSAVFYNTLDVQTGGELRVSKGSTATFFGQVQQRTGSLFTGTGTKFYEGGLSIGASPGLGTDGGDVAFGELSTYLAEIGGTTACTLACGSDDALKNSSFDKYIVAGELTFGGTLKLASWNSFVAQAGQRFDLFDWGTSTGQFSAIDASGLNLAPGLALDTSQLYVDGSIGIQAVPEPSTWALLLAGLGFMGWRARRGSQLSS